MSDPLPQEVLSALAALPTSDLANAIETFHLRLRNEGFCDASIQCRLPALPPIVGYAVTLRIRSANPPLEGGAYVERNDWWDQLERQPFPRVLVIQDIDRTPGVGAVVGEVHAAILQALGCVGVVTNGAVRDLRQVGALGFALFSRNLSTSHAYVHVVDSNVPVQVGGLNVQPGDLLHGDVHGLLRIPREIAAALPAAATRIRARDAEIVAYCASKEFTKEGLRRLLAMRR